MTDVIPAAPGWYLRETDGDTVVLDPVIAWLPGTTGDGEPTLLPFVGNGTGAPPVLIGAADFQYWKRCVVYLPNYDPAAGSESP